eukprot:EG_transcript_9820
MPFLHCVDCGTRTFKNWDANDTDDEEDYYCRQCCQDTQWITEAEFAELRKNRRPGDRRNSEEYRMNQKLFEEIQARKLAEQQQRRSHGDPQPPPQPAPPPQPPPQRRVPVQAWGSPRSSSPAPSSNSTPRPYTSSGSHPTPRVDSTMTDEDDGRCRSPVAASPGRLEHPAPPMYQQRQSSTMSSVPNSPITGPPEQLLEVLLREVPTLGAYIRRLRAELLAARRERSTAVDQALDWQRREEEARTQRATAVQEAKALGVQNAELHLEVVDLRANVAALTLQLQAFGATPLVVEPHAPVIVATIPADDAPPPADHSAPPPDPEIKSEPPSEPTPRPDAEAPPKPEPQPEPQHTAEPEPQPPPDVQPNPEPAPEPEPEPQPDLPAATSATLTDSDTIVSEPSDATAGEEAPPPA